MTDQDLDGSHIKGLCINIFHALWPELFKLHGFIGFMNTPILKAKKGNAIFHFIMKRNMLHGRRSMVLSVEK